MEKANKHAQELISYIDKEFLPRIKLGYSKGLYKTSIYYMADKPSASNRLKVSIMSLFQGDKSTFSPLRVHQINMNNLENQSVLRLFQNGYLNERTISEDVMLLLSEPVDKNKRGISTYLNASEISVVAGLPQKEVLGMDRFNN